MIEMLARHANAKVMDILRENFSKDTSVTPQEFGLNLVAATATEDVAARIMTLHLLSALIHYSLRSVSKEKFLAEMEQALSGFSAYMAAEMRARGN